MSVREIAEEIGIGKSVVHRMKQKIEQRRRRWDRTRANSRGGGAVPCPARLGEGTQGQRGEPGLAPAN
jgi:hypothetical protein